MTDSRATMSFRRPSAGPADGRFYLLVIEGDRSKIHPLPTDGMVLIGRGDEADLSLDDESISRRHARLVIARREARIQDLDSHNGTRVNGTLLNGTAQALASGDVIGIGAATLVFHDGGRAHTARALADAATVRRRLEEELDRGLRYARPASLVALGFDVPPRPELADAVAPQLRLLDVAGLGDDGHLYVLCPELAADAARDTAFALLAATGGDARVGLASFPVDGADAETLWAAARSAVRAAKPGHLQLAGDLATTITVGDRTVIAADPALVRIYALLERLAASTLPVLILGETGVGKENAAYAVHAFSPRKAQPFKALNCAALQETLIESELFGYEKGAFSGATQAKLGLLEAANGGTVFLDEAGELSPPAQAKLLRVLETGLVQRLGDVKERKIDVRVVAATNRSLEDEVKAGRFRQDLYFRLSAATVVIPPLRERRREIPVLAQAFVTHAGKELTLSREVLARLGSYDWPGNVRELRNAIAYAVATCDEDEIQLWHLPDKIAGVEPTEAAPAGADAAGQRSTFRPIGEELKELEKRRMIEALNAAGGVQRRAAELLSMPLRTFVLKYKQYALKK